MTTKIGKNNMEDLYLKSIQYYIMIDKNQGMCKYSDEDWYGFSTFYNIDIIKYILSNNNEEYGNLFTSTYIYDMFLYYFVVKELEDIWLDNEYDSISNNIIKYKQIVEKIITLNGDISNRKFFKHGCFSTSYIPQEKVIKNLNAIHKQLILVEQFPECFNIALLKRFYVGCNKQIKMCADMLFLILSLQGIEFCPFLDEKSKELSKKIQDHLYTILKHANVLGIYKNMYYFDEKVQSEDRDSSNQTTRLQILYEYSNGDDYSLRLDLAHKGVPYFHLNITSKGNCDFFPISENVLNNIVDSKKEYNNWFIHYGNGKYFLKECYKKEIYKVEHTELLSILKREQHAIVDENVEEEGVIELFDWWLNFMANVGKNMPKEKMDPSKIYFENFLYSALDEYFWIKSDQKSISLADERLRFLLPYANPGKNEDDIQTKLFLINICIAEEIAKEAERSELLEWSIADVFELLFSSI